MNYLMKQYDSWDETRDITGWNCELAVLWMIKIECNLKISRNLEIA